MNSKGPLLFFSASVILILLLILVGIPVNSTSLHQSDKLIPEMQLQNDKEQHTIEDIILEAETKPIEEMNCTDLNEFITSFEKGWSAVIPMYNENCS